MAKESHQIRISNAFDSLLDGITEDYGLEFPTRPPTEPFLQTQASSNPKKKRKLEDQAKTKTSENVELESWFRYCTDEIDRQMKRSENSKSSFPLWWGEDDGKKIRFGKNSKKQGLDHRPVTEDKSPRKSHISAVSVWAMETQARFQMESEMGKVRRRFDATTEDEFLPLYLPLEPSSKDQILDLNQQIIHKAVINPTKNQQTLKISNSNRQFRLLIPPRSLFLLTDLLQDQKPLPFGFEQTLSLLSPSSPSSFSLAKRKGLDLILVDPPYPNYSAERLSKEISTHQSQNLNRTRPSHSYSTVSDLYDLWPLKTSLNYALELGGGKRGTMVGCWVTNSPKCKKFILEKLFPQCHLRFLKSLSWLKVTGKDISSSSPTLSKGGEPILSLNSKDGRKPFEILLLARYDPPQEFSEKISKKQTSSQPLNPEPKIELESEDETIWKWDDDLPDLTLISVSLGHSRKPDVLDLLRPYLPFTSKQSSSQMKTGPNVLEIFSRHVKAGPTEKVENDENRGIYISVGNESCAFNEVDSDESNGYFTRRKN